MRSVKSVIFPNDGIRYKAARPFCAWDCFMSLLFLLTSGVVVWHGLLTPAVSMSFFFVCSAFTFWKKHRKFNDSFIFYLISLGFILLNFLIYRPQFQNNSVLGYIVCLLASAICLACYDFYYFRKLLSDWLYLICIVSLIFFALEEFNVIVPKRVDVNGNVYQMIGPFVYGFESGVNHRFISLWHEAGAFQIILNTIILLHLDSFKTWKWEPGRLKRMILFIICLVLTQSTGGYLCIGIITVAVATNLKFELTKKQKLIILPAIFLILIAAIALIFTSDVVVKKLGAEEGDIEAVSKFTRMYDALSCWQLSVERPILGWGLGSSDFYRYSSKLGNTTSSSGLLKFAACMGWIWIICLLFYVWRGSRKIFKTKSAICCLACYIVMMMNEDFVEFPISNILIFYFASYCKPSVLFGKKAIMHRKRIVINKTKSHEI